MSEDFKPVYVTQPFLPPLEEFVPYLERIWESKRLTNNGPLHAELEKALSEYLNVPHISLFTNGTIALITALQSLNVTGEVITTPYSFVATAHSLVWNNIKPVFVDTAPDSFNMDPNRIEAAITPHTTAILAVHCYGQPCVVERIEEIANEYGLHVIYDAAHAFGVNYKGGSLLNHGNLSVLSFHATKVFSTAEGGAIICNDIETKQRIDRLKNFGFVDEVTVATVGINGKMSEINAAFGLLHLKYVDQAIGRRRNIDEFYRRSLAGLPGIGCPQGAQDATQNYSYFPILVDREYPLTRDELYQKLKNHGIHARRYFYPLISNMPMYCELLSSSRTNLPNVNRLAEQVLCLPIYPDLSDEQVGFVVSLILEA